MSNGRVSESMILSRRSRRRVLLIEDDPVQARRISGLLTESDPALHVDHIPTGRGALEKLGADTYDAAVLDLAISDDRRSEMLRESSRWTDRVPIVALVQTRDPSLLEACRKAGIQEHARKDDPSGEPLRRALDESIERYRAIEIQRRMEAIDRQVSLGRIAGGIVHEINNQATVVLANLENAQLALESLRPHVAPDGRAALAEVSESLKINVSALSRLASIAEEMRRFSRLHPIPMLTRVDLRSLVLCALRLVAGRVRRKVRVETHLMDVPPVVGDETKLTQVLVNLLINALDALEESPSDPSSIRISTRQRNQQALLMIEDTGCGIPPENMDRLFEPFFSSKPIDRGTGLGLSISSEIIASFGGSISVESKLGQGTTFTVRLPLAHTANAPATIHAKPEPVAVQRARLLLVDDQDAPRRALQRMLARDHDVLDASSGAEALACIERSEPFDAVICDLMMPELDGPAVFERARALDPDLEHRFLFLTGGIFTERAQEFLERSAQPVVTKPISRSALLSRIDSLLREAPLRSTHDRVS